VMVDASKSYREHFADAVQSATKLLDQLSQEDVKRWEPARDRITLISLDAMPEILWSGTLQDLQREGTAALPSRLEARKDFDACTDVGGGFRLALRELGPEQPGIGRYLFVYSDLLDDPPTTSLRTCQRPPRAIPPELDWEALQGIAVAAFSLTPEQKFAWSKELQARGLTETFKLYTPAESGVVTIPVPTRAVASVEPDPELKRKIGHGVKTTVKYAGLALLLLATLPLIAWLVGRKRRAALSSFREP